MASPHDFKAALPSISHLYFKATISGKAILGTSLVSSSDRWKLSLVLLSDSSTPTLFEKALVYSDIQALTRTLGDFTWSVFFSHIKAVLKNSELVVDTKMKDAVHLYFPRHEGGLSSPIDIILPLSPSEDKMALSTFMFTFVERIQTLETKLTASEASHAAAAKKAEISSPTKKSPDYDSGVQALGLVGATSSSPTQGTEGSAKKTHGGSLLNPRAKKYVPKPTTLSSNQ